MASGSTRRPSDVIDVISPHTEEVVGRVPEASTADVDRAVAAARAAFDDGDWPRLSPEERIAAVQRFADVYMARMLDMAEIITDGDGLADHVLAARPVGRRVDDAQHVRRHRRGSSRGRRRAPACSAPT